MSHELPPRPDYSFPETGDPELIEKVFGYADAVSARNVLADSVGWQGSGAYFAAHTEVAFKRRVNRITVNPDEAVSKLGIADEEGELLPGFCVTENKGQVVIGYEGKTDKSYFDTMDRLIEWGEELTAREEAATVRERAAHFMRRIGVAGRQVTFII